MATAATMIRPDSMVLQDCFRPPPPSAKSSKGNELAPAFSLARAAALQNGKTLDNTSNSDSNLQQRLSSAFFMMTSSANDDGPPSTSTRCMAAVESPLLDNTLSTLFRGNTPYWQQQDSTAWCGTAPTRGLNGSISAAPWQVSKQSSSKTSNNQQPAAIGKATPTAGRRLGRVHSGKSTAATILGPSLVNDSPQLQLRLSTAFQGQVYVW